MNGLGFEILARRTSVPQLPPRFTPPPPPSHTSRPRYAIIFCITLNIAADGREQNSVDPDQTPQSAASDQSLQFASHPGFFDTSKGNEIDWFEFQILGDKYSRFEVSEYDIFFFYLYLK